MAVRRRQGWRWTALLVLASAWAGGCVSGRAGRHPPATPPPATPPAAHRAPAHRAPAAPGRRTVDQVLNRLGPAVDGRLAPFFARAGMSYPPQKVFLLAFKRERRLELWAADGGPPAFIRSYRILDASGHSGPKLKEWDMQVPEGIYRIVWLHPNSHYHLSLKLDYPNGFDREKARANGRTNLGGDIFIHGGDRSIGCLAIGDRPIEELFVLVARVGVDRVEAVLAPNDLRRGPPASRADAPSWISELYLRIVAALVDFRLP